MTYSRFILLLSAMASIPTSVCGQKASPPVQARPANSKVVVPAQTTIPLSLKNTINSRTAFVGQEIYCETIYPITIGNRIVIPAGSYVKGSITQVVRPGRIKGKAQLGLRLDSLTLPNGTTRLLRATLSGFTGTGQEEFRRGEAKIQGESSKTTDAGTVAAGAGEGAVVGGLAGRSVKGLGIGAAAGTAGGLIWVLATRGKDIVLPPGTSLEVQLTAPLSFDRDELDPSPALSKAPEIPRREPGSCF